MTTMTAAPLRGASPLPPLHAGERLALRVADALQEHVRRRACARAARLAADLAREAILAESRRAGDLAAARTSWGLTRG
ncbi:hypothetical protein QWJ90_00695 [Microbacterium oryzae]|uniref:hypothetical protein n=1 Tax=Microbacterium oryzae TaxID=743009 RepID=UPI0025B1A0D6|nr:hypothetical protein [Microbacterium oryzae]MDN3309446.1 hypothetical protein [Microbacterium oryzae]